MSFVDNASGAGWARSSLAWPGLLRPEARQAKLGLPCSGQALPGHARPNGYLAEFSTFSFQITVLSIFLPLSNGTLEGMPDRDVVAMFILG